MKIAYGICGEGQGHAGRSSALIEELSKDHEVHIFAGAEAKSLLSMFGFPRINEIPSLRFIHKNGKIQLFKSAIEWWRFQKRTKDDIARIESYLISNKIELVITDFESLIVQAAKKVKVPIISVDNQHKFLMRQKGLPLRLQLYAFGAGIFTRMLIRNPNLIIVTTFHDNQGKGYATNVMVRKEYAAMNVSDQGHVLVYIKPYLADKILPVLKEIPTTFLVYGSGKNINEKNLIFKETSAIQFGLDLAAASGVICCAGNQLIGESRYFGKPILAIPVPGQDEQLVNGWCVKQEKIGDFCTIDDFSVEKVKHFIHTMSPFPRSENGVHYVKKIIESLDINSFVLQ